MTSVDMMLNTYGKIGDPGAFNSWLKSHGGYASGCLIIWGSVSSLGFKYIGKVSRDKVKSNFDSGKHLVLNVNGGRHWVLMKGYSGNTIHVNDPGNSSKKSYQVGEIVEAAVYQKA